jgi:hypothetical protein
MHYFYVHKTWADVVFVKTNSYFIAQNGRTEKWGKNWNRIRACSIEHAREIGRKSLEANT